MLERKSILDIRSSINKITTLPAMPAMATKLLGLRNSPDADADDLASIIELDPSLAGQISHYAASPFYGYGGELNSIRDAIARVLGFDRVIHVAIGLALGKSFQITPYGPIGLQALWRHSIYTAALMEMLVSKMKLKPKPTPGLAYLAGLLHNMGFLVLGHFYPREFNALNKAIAEQPDARIIDIESYILGTDHCEIGTWLMRKWDLPPEIITAVYEHHNDEYRGQFANYSNLMLVASRLLKRYGIGDMSSGDIPDALFSSLALAEEDAVLTLDALIEDTRALDFMVSEMVNVQG